MKNNITHNNTIFILDWDDTLFPTSWVSKNKINMTSNSDYEQYIVYFQELDRILSKFLTNLQKLGRIIIVTNAMPEWIKLSSIAIPQTYNILNSIVVISSRNQYRKISSNMMDWKKMAFNDIIENCIKYNQSVNNIISIGDADYEYQALISLNKKFNKHNNKFLKSIKLIKKPSHDMLIDQLEVLNNAIKSVSQKEKHLDLKFNLYSKLNN